MPDFYPRRDAELLTWSRSFAANVGASPGAYGLTAQDAADFAGLQQAFAHWYTLSQGRATRTAVSIRMKDEARRAMMGKGRELAALVRARPGVTNEQLVSLGLGARRRSRRAVGRPTGAPRVRVRVKYGAGPVMKLTDAVSGRSRKPAGVSMAVVLYAVGDAPPADEGGWRFGLTTGDPVFRWVLPVVGGAGEAARPGDRVWLIACWVNDRGERGPWSEPACWWVSHECLLVSPGVVLKAA